MKLSCHEWPSFSALPVSKSHRLIRENNRGLRSAQCNKLVAHPPDSDDQFRVLGILLQFLTKVANMNIHSPRECSAVITPDRAQEFVTRERSSGPFNEVTKKLKLQLCETNRFAVSRDLASPDIYSERAKLMNILTQDPAQF